MHTQIHAHTYTDSSLICIHMCMYVCACLSLSKQRRVLPLSPACFVFLVPSKTSWTTRACSASTATTVAKAAVAATVVAFDTEWAQAVQQRVEAALSTQQSQQPKKLIDVNVLNLHKQWLKERREGEHRESARELRISHLAAIKTKTNNC